MNEEDENSISDTVSFLTERQIEVLQLRHKGLTQQEVADMLGTTRPNICILEKRAHQKIARAQNTLRQWITIQAPISLKVATGTDIFDIPARIFEAADRSFVTLPVTSLDIIDQLRRGAPLLFKKRALLQDIEIHVAEDGKLIIQESSQGSSPGSSLYPVWGPR